MPLQEYLLPGEEVHYHSNKWLKYGSSKYNVVATNKRVLMYAMRGMFFRSDDVISFKMDDLQGVKYREEGYLPRVGIIEIQGRTTIRIEGLASEAKTVYQQLLQFL